MKGLSICVPVYNFNCIDSIKTLSKQISDLSIEAEILLIDDASTILLDELVNFQHPLYSYEKLTQNIGRSKIRNLLVKKSNYDHILFLDGDSGIPENFIKHYLLNKEKFPNAIIYGGRVHKKTPGINRLRFKYGIKFEDTKPSDRIKKPYHSFTTNNFLVPKEIMEKIPFNKELTKYGHEDTFFGYELKKNKVEIIHIDNPVIPLDLETNRNFIEKTKHSIENLILLKTKYPEFADYSKLLSTIYKFRIFRLKFVKQISENISRIFEFMALRSSSVYSFQIFKLFYTISHIR